MLEGNSIRRSFRSNIRVVASITAAFIVHCGLCLGQTSGAGAATSGPATEATGVLDEITVTAERREENAQDVGISMAAFSGGQLRSLGISETTDIARFVPGVTLTGSAGGQFVSFAIRGVAQNDFSDFAESPNAVYIDDAYIAMMNSQRFATFDMERVEILKGPQGTLFGRNATGGLVQYVSRKPTAQPDGYVDVEYGSYGRVRLESALGGSVNDSVRVRGAVFYTRQNSYIENKLPGEFDLGNENTLAARVHVEILPADNVNILLTGYGGYTIESTPPYLSSPTVAIFDANGNVFSSITAGPNETRGGIGPNGNGVCVGCLIPPTRPVPGGEGYGYTGSNVDALQTSTDLARSDGGRYWMWGTTAHLTWDLAHAQFVSVTDFKETSKDEALDGDGGPVNLLVVPARARGTQLSQELRLGGTDGSLRWLTGLYFLDFKLNPVTNGFVFPAASVTGPNVLGPAFAGTWFRNSGNQNTHSYSAFADLTYSLTSSLDGILGARVIRENKAFSHRADIYDETGTTLLVPDFNPAALQNLTSSNTLWSGRAQLNWHASDAVLVYGGVNRGVKAGGFNQDLAGFPPVPPSFEYKPEILTAYELGIKSTLPGGKVRVNGSIYDYNYKDYQAFKFTGLSDYVVNADAKYRGAELEIAASPVEDLNLSLSGSYIDARVKNVPFSSGPGGVDSVYLDRQPAYTPKFQAAGLIRYGWSVGSGTLSGQFDVNWASGFYYFLTNYPSTLANSHAVGDVRVSYATNDKKWTAEAYVNNVWDERYVVTGFDLSTVCGCSVRSYGMPRTVGVGLRYSVR